MADISLFGASNQHRPSPDASKVTRQISFLPARIVAALLTCLIFVACADANEPMRLAVEDEELIVLDGETERARFSIEVAKTNEQRSAGLMFRTDLPKDRGMLFIFEDEAERFFWMENTPTPLDIIYAKADGTIVHIAENTSPFSRTPIPSRFPAKFAFEIHAGLSVAFSIAPGQKLEHPLIREKQK